MVKFEFNDKLGNRDRKCHIAVVSGGKAFSQHEAIENKIAIFRSLDYEKGGKWSNTTWEATVNSASLVVFMAPFDGWPETKELCIEHIQGSSNRYLGCVPTNAEAELALSLCCPKLWQRLQDLEQLESQLV